MMTMSVNQAQDLRTTVEQEPSCR